MAVDLNANLLAYEAEFLARLATVPGLATVGGYAEFDRDINGGEVDAAGDPVPPALPGGYLLYGGTTRETAPRGNQASTPLILTQDWQVLVLARPQVNVGGVSELAPSLGATLSAVLTAFKGWQPEGAIFPIEHVWPEDDAIVAYGHGLVNAELLFRVTFKLS